MIQVKIQKHILEFKFEAGTSRGILKEKTTWFVIVFDGTNPEIKGIGECGPLTGLSTDDIPDFEIRLQEIIADKRYLDLQNTHFQQFPSVIFAFETALADFKSGGIKKIFDNNFFRGEDDIPINGLIWMGNKEFMVKQIREKLNAGFSCLKLKIGAIDFKTELDILSMIRKEFRKDITLRLDANGAFSAQSALEKLKQLAEFEIHSIEQPIKAGQIEEMASLCQQSPIPIALDEELIGVFSKAKENLILDIKPQFIILKPTLLGGFAHCDQWITIAEKTNSGWWLTSALESNIGLNAISQYAYEKIKEYHNKPLQGLGTGSLYHNNISSPLQISGGNLRYNSSLSWGNI